MAERLCEFESHLGHKELLDLRAALFLFYTPAGMRKYYYNDKGYMAVDTPSRASWICVNKPDTDDVRFLIEDEKVPPILLEYLEDKDERPRVERNGDWLMTIIRIPIPGPGTTLPYITIPMGIISHTGSRHVITVCSHPNSLTDDFADHTRHNSICVNALSDFVLRIFFSTAHWYLRYLELMSEYVIGTEKALERSVENNDLKQLMSLQKSLVYFNTSIKGNLMVLERIANIYGDDIDRELLEDVEIEMRQADTTAGISNDIIKATMDSYSSIISNNVNNVMKRMSALSIILIVPTFVASLYGMNVDILLSSPYAFWIILGIAALLTTLAFLCLKHLRWL